MKYILVTTVAVLSLAVIFFGIKNGVFLKLKGGITKEISFKKEMNVIDSGNSSAESNILVDKSISKTDLKDTYLDCVVGTKGSFSISDEPFFTGTISLTADYEILKKENDICTIFYSKYRDVSVIKDGVLDEATTKGINDSYKTMTVTCKMTKEDREKAVAAMGSKDFSFSYNSNDVQKCDVAGI